jgi:hypothetical protein
MSSVRVWAEERGANTVLLTWSWPDDECGPTPERDRAAEARAIAATIGVRPGVLSSAATDEGVLVTYDPSASSKPEIAAALRAALALDADLRTRTNELVKRVPTYLSLAGKLAMDERVSPVPQAAREMSQRRMTPTPMRFIPGATLITRINTIVPVLRSLVSWSREAPPGVVDEHLSAANLTRETLERDLATAHESIAYAKAYTTQAAGRAARKAVSVATQARSAARDWQQKRGNGPAGDGERDAPNERDCDTVAE